MGIESTMERQVRQSMLKFFHSGIGDGGVARSIRECRRAVPPRDRLALISN
jgi:hypothetical protein